MGRNAQSANTGFAIKEDFMIYFFIILFVLFVLILLRMFDPTEAVLFSGLMRGLAEQRVAEHYGADFEKCLSESDFHGVYMEKWMELSVECNNIPKFSFKNIFK